MKHRVLYSVPLVCAAVGLLAGCVSGPPLPKLPPPPAGNTVQKPRIKIYNNYHQEMVFGVDGAERRVVTIAPESTLVIRLKEGVYRYAAAAKGAKAVTGFKQFERNHHYDLKFGVGSGRAD